MVCSRPGTSWLDFKLRGHGWMCVIRRHWRGSKGRAYRNPNDERHGSCSVLHLFRVCVGEKNGLTRSPPLTKLLALYFGKGTTRLRAFAEEEKFCMSDTGRQS